MADVERIIERIRANGANVVVDDGRLRVVNGENLPPAALDYIREHSAAIVAHLRGHPGDDVQPEKASPHHVGWLTGYQADELSRLLMANDPGDPDWTWFVSRAQKILDGIVMPEATA